MIPGIQHLHRLSSVCDEARVTSASDSQEKIHEKIHRLNDILTQLFQRWATNLSHLRELSAAVIQMGNHERSPITLTHTSLSTDLSLPDTADQLQGQVAEILAAFQAGALIHCGSYCSVVSLPLWPAFD